jgi:hypothetical protein
MRILRPILLPLACLSVAACGANQTYPTPQTYQAAQAQPLSCVPTLDGQISADQLQAAVAVPVSYLVTPQGGTRTVNLDGSVNAQGQQVWDWSYSAPDDELATIEAQTLGPQWYANSFPGGQFEAPLDLADTLEAVYIHSDQALSLMGIASSQQNPANGETLIVYQQPVALYQFPLTVGSSWTSVGIDNNSTVDGLPYASTDTYQVSVDASGELLLPDVTFTQALRVRTQTTIVPVVGATVVTQQTSFLFQCFGEVARATSQSNETNPDFTTAAEVRRLSLLRGTP